MMMMGRQGKCDSCICMSVMHRYNAVFEVNPYEINWREMKVT